MSDTKAEAKSGSLQIDQWDFSRCSNATHVSGRHSALSALGQKRTNEIGPEHVSSALLFRRLPFQQFYCIVDFDTEVSDGALNLRMAE